jgi:hypothetical protein
MIHRTAREAVIFMLVAAVLGSIGVGAWVWSSHRPIIDTSKAELDLSADLVPIRKEAVTDKVAALGLFCCIGAQTSTGPAKARGIVENQV